MKRQPIGSLEAETLARYGLDGLDLTHAARASFAQGEYLIREGEPLDVLYFVVSGRAKVCVHASNGKQLLLCYFASTGVFGDVELMTGSRAATTTIQAVSDLVCVVLPLAVYGAELKQNIVFLNCVGKELSEKLVKSGINGAIKILHPLEARLCAYIIQTAIGGSFREPLTETAALVGTSYRHLLRSLGTLCAQGVLERHPSGYRIAQATALREKAGDLYLL